MLEKRRKRANGIMGCHFSLLSKWFNVFFTNLIWNNSLMFLNKYVRETDITTEGETQKYTQRQMDIHRDIQTESRQRNKRTELNTLPINEYSLLQLFMMLSMCVRPGKWHLGMGCGLLGKNCRGPQEHGFQHFFGLPFTLDEDAVSPHPFFYFPLDGSDSFYQVRVCVGV